MKKKIATGVIVTSIVLTTLSFIFFIGLFVFNIRRMIAIENVSALGVIISSLLVLGSLFLVFYIIVLSFIPFFTKRKVSITQYMNILVIAIVYRLILYVIFELLGDPTGNVYVGLLSDTHYYSYILTYRTDLLPVGVFPGGTLAFIHSLMGTDIVAIGLVIIGLQLAERDKYAPLIGAVLAIIINLIFIFAINSIIVNTYEGTLLYYKFDTIIATLVVEFALLGYVIHHTFLGKSRNS